MGQQQVVGTVIECANLAIIGINGRNPHNNGGTCVRCEQQDESDADGGTDDEAAPETLPLVTRSADTVDSSTVMIVNMMLMTPRYDTSHLK